MNSCKYLKSETHLRSAQVNKAPSVNKGIVKTCLIVDVVRRNWSWLVVASCGLHYFVSDSFGSFGVVADFSTAKRFKYLFFTAMKTHTMARTKILPARCLYETVRLSVLFANSRCTLFQSAQSFSFELNKNTIQILCR